MTIFNVIYVLLDEDETVLWKVMLITIMDYFIMAQFTFMSAVILEALNNIRLSFHGDLKRFLII